MVRSGLTPALQRNLLIIDFVSFTYDHQLTPPIQFALIEIGIY